MGVNTTNTNKKTKEGGKNNILNFHIISLFPESFDSYIDKSIIGRAIKNNLIKINFYNPKDFAEKNNAGISKVDDRPYGGGPGMIIQAEPIIKCIDKILLNENILKKTTLMVFLSPQGDQFDTNFAKKISKKYKDIIIICGRYEGIDSRVKKVFKMIDVSIGPWVTTGGELPALIMIDVISRQIEGVLGKIESLEETRIASDEMYTRPEVLIYNKKKYKVPKVLLSGNHKEIENWRAKRLSK